MSKKIKISDLKFDPRNINKGSQYGNGLLEESLRQAGAGRSILIDKNNVIIAGNQTAQKAGELGLDNVIVVESDGTSIIAVKRTDIDINSPQGARLKILDNTVSKHNYVEDVVLADAICQELQLDAASLGIDTNEQQTVSFHVKAKEEFTLKLAFKTEKECKKWFDKLKEEGLEPLMK